MTVKLKYDFYSARNGADHILIKYPELQLWDLTRAIEAEAAYLRSSGTGRMTESRSIDQATKLVEQWLDTAEEFHVTCEWDNLANFVSCRHGRSANLWAVFKGKAIQEQRRLRAQESKEKTAWDCLRQDKT